MEKEIYKDNEFKITKLSENVIKIMGINFKKANIILIPVVSNVVLIETISSKEIRQKTKTEDL